MKTILITGGLGFIGSHFIQLLFTNKKYKDDIRIINIDKDTLNRKNHKHLQHLYQIKDKNRYLYRNADICDLTKMQALIYLYRPDKIIHFAAQSHVDNSIQTPELHTHTNITGTISLLIAASKYYNVLLNEQQKKKFRFHHISTDQVFGDLQLDSKKKFSEFTKYNPSSPYSASKAASDHLVNAWSRTYNLPISISNCSNNYGIYQDDSKLIPKVIQACIDESPITIHGTGQYIRDWIFVQDHCNGILKMIQNLKLSHNETFLFGGNCQKSNLQIINIICNLMDYHCPRKNKKSYHQLKIFVQNRKGQDLRYAINSSKAQFFLNWKITGYLQKQIEKIVQYKIKNSQIGIF